MSLAAHKRAAVIALIGIALLLTGCGRVVSRQPGKMLVAASIAPLANWSKEVGGNLVQVELLVPPAANPHIYQPMPSQMSFLSDAQVLVLNGLHLEFWADKAIDAANNPKLVIVETAKGIKPLGGDPDSPAGNPHTWLDPKNAILQVEAIRDAFIKADPKHAAEYTDNAERYIRRLRKLDQDIRAEVKTFRNKDFISAHPSWVYFAHEYGLVDAASIERSPGREPSAADIREIVDVARKIKARAIFAEPQFSPKGAEVVAEETGAKVLYLDPYGKPPDYDYIRTMRYNLNELADALK